MVTTADVDSRKRRKPFVPIKFVTDSGEAIEVHDPQMLMVGVRDILVGFPTRRHPGICERISKVQLADIVAIEDLPTSTARELNNGNTSSQ